MRLIVIDPRRTHLAGLADFFLQLRPGTDGALALGMLRVIIEERLYDQDFVAKWVRGFNELKAAVARYTPEETERITGIPAEKIAQAARMFATVGPAALMESASATTHTANGVQNHRAILALVGLTGNFDAPGGNVIVPAVQTRNITLYHEKIASLPRRMGEERWPVWARLYPEGQCNMMADQILSGKPHPIKGMVAVGANVRMGPDSRKTIAAWKSLDFLVASDFFMTSTTRLADIVLPAAFSLERTNLIVRGDFVMLRQAALEPPGEVWPDQRFIFELAARLGLEDKFWNGDLELAFAEELEPSGITLDELKQNPGGIRVDLGPVQYYKYREKGFPTPSGKMEIRSSLLEEYGYEPLPIYREPPESPLSTPELAREFPLVLTTGGRLPMFVHTMLRNVEAIRRLHPEPQVDINPKDARSRGIACGDKVILATPRGEITFVANVTVAVPPGVVHVLHGWEQADINEVLEGDNLDPISGFPCFKGVLCQVKRRFGSSGQTPTPPAAAPSKG